MPERRGWLPGGWSRYSEGSADEPDTLVSHLEDVADRLEAPALVTRDRPGLVDGACPGQQDRLRAGRPVAATGRLTTQVGASSGAGPHLRRMLMLRVRQLILHHVHQDETRAAYDGVVELYASMFTGRLETRPFARNMIGTFAELVRATGNLRVADIG